MAPRSSARRMLTLSSRLSPRKIQPIPSRLLSPSSLPFPSSLRRQRPRASTRRRPSVNDDGKSTATITVTLQGFARLVATGARASWLYLANRHLGDQRSEAAGDRCQRQHSVHRNRSRERNSYLHCSGRNRRQSCRFRQSRSVDFTGSTPNSCGSGLPQAAPGFVVTPYATGFSAQTLYDRRQRRHQFRLPGAAGIAFDSSGNLYVNEFTTGNIQVPSRRRRGGPGTKLNSTSLG